MAQSRARRYSPASAASSGGWRSSRICSPCHSARQPGSEISTAVHSPWRTVSRTSRTALRRARAAMGAVALTRPSAKKAMAEYRLAPSALAGCCEPRRPMNITSVTVMAIWARLLSTSGRASISVATISGFHARRFGAGWAGPYGFFLIATPNLNRSPDLRRRRIARGAAQTWCLRRLNR